MIEMDLLDKPLLRVTNEEEGYRMAKMKLSAALVLAGMLLLSACGGGGSSDSNQPKILDAAAAEHADAAAVYRSKCMSCHGNDLQGRSGPNLQKVGSKYDAAEIKAIITNGKTNRGMPAFGKSLDEAQIEQLTVWLSGLQ